MKTTPLPHPCTPLATALLLAMAIPAYAEGTTGLQADTTFDPIKVQGEAVEKASSPKFTAPLLDTPQTISVIPEDVFRAQGARNLTEVLRNTPGISFNAGENGFSTSNNNFSMRGFDTSGSIFIDGVRDSGNHARDVFDVERVEVAKGPAADNGRGGPGGYVNMVTKSPALGYFVHGSASHGADAYDTHARIRGTVDINQQLGATSALRLNLLAQDGGVAGRAFATSDAVGVAPSLAFGLGTGTRVALVGRYLNQSGRPEWGVPGAFIEDTVNYDPSAAQADRDTFYGLSTDFDENASRSVLARIEHDFPGFTLTNQTRWTQTERTALYTVPSGYDADTGTVDARIQAYDRENGNISNLTDVGASFQTGAIGHTLSAGLEFSRERSEGLRYGTGTAPATDVLAPDPRRAVATLPEAEQDSRVDIDTVALYAYDTMTFNERWQLTGGLRAERYEVDVASTDLATGEPQGPDGYEASDTSLSGKLGVVYKPGENGSLYASVSIATLPPGSWLSNPDISRTGDGAFPGLVGQNNQAAKPQRAVNHEIGAKWNFFDDRLTATAAVFQTTRRSVAITGVDPDVDNSPELLRGYGRHVVRGVELGLHGMVTDAWTVFAGAAFLDSARRHDAWLDAARRGARPADYGDALTTDGDELAFTPRRSANLWTTYDLGNGLLLGAGVQHVGDSWAGRPDDADRIIANGRYGKLPGYTVGNLMASWAVSDSLALRLNIDNVSDETYATSGNWPMSRVLLGPSRAWMLSADFRF